MNDQIPNEPTVKSSTSGYSEGSSIKTFLILPFL